MFVFHNVTAATGNVLSPNFEELDRGCCSNISCSDLREREGLHMIIIYCRYNGIPLCTTYVVLIIV